MSLASHPPPSFPPYVSDLYCKKPKAHAFCQPHHQAPSTYTFVNRHPLHTPQAKSYRHQLHGPPSQYLKHGIIGEGAWALGGHIALAQSTPCPIEKTLARRPEQCLLLEPRVRALLACTGEWQCAPETDSKSLNYN